MSCDSISLCFVFQKSDGHISLSLSNRFLSKSDVIREIVTETTTLKKNCRLNVTSYLRGSENNIDILIKYHQGKEYRFCKTNKKILLAELAVMHVDKWAAYNFTCTGKIV